MRHLTYIEIDTPPWVEPGPTMTWRFTQPSDYLPREIDAIPSIASVSYSPVTVSLGSDLGQRATLSVTFSDHRHVFNGEPFNQGTFWGKWRGRYGTRLRGKPLRWIQGRVGQSLAAMETRHFVIETVSGPSRDGTYTIHASDILRLADADRALAPRPNSGFLLAAITNAATSATLAPTGIGNAEYASAGYVNLGGKEVCQFTRSGDVLTLTRSASVPTFGYETDVVAHDAGTRVQQCLPFVAATAAGIIATLLQTYAGVPGSYIPLSEWSDEVAAFLATVYTTLITEPTAVNKLISDIVEQAALAVWWDDVNRKIRLQVLRAVATSAAQFTDEQLIEDSLQTQEQPERRLSEVITYFAIRNPLKSIEDPDNYRSAALTIDTVAESAYQGRANRVIYSRWIPFGGRNTALRLNNLLIGRFRDPPRRITFDLWRHNTAVDLGGGYRLGWAENQDASGLPVLAPVQVTRLNPAPDRYRVEAEEVLWSPLDPIDLQNRLIIVDSNIRNINLRSLHDTLYPVITPADVTAGVTLTCVIASGVVVGSNTVSEAAFDTGTFPTGLPITIKCRGRIQGKGGDGGRGRSAFQPSTWDDGQPGGAALRVRVPITLINASGQIWGGGGGGQGGITSTGFAGGGGGGAGDVPGAGGPAYNSSTQDGQPGTQTAGGACGATGGSSGYRSASNGGGPGLSAAGDDGGAAGPAIDGISMVTVSGAPGDRRGPEIN
jgi:hypothetical protein